MPPLIAIGKRKGSFRASLGLRQGMEMVEYFEICASAPTRQGCGACTESSEKT